MTRRSRNKPKREAASLKRVPKGDSIRTTKVPRAKAPKKLPQPPLDLDAVEWRAVITIHRADELTDAHRYYLVNWLRAKANELGDDTYGRNLASTYRARTLI